MRRQKVQYTALFVVMVVAGALLATSTSSAGPVTCFGEEPTIVAVRGQVTRGTSGPDVILGTSGRDVIYGRGGKDLICSRGGNDVVEGGKGSDRINLGSGHDRAKGGSGNDELLGKRGRDHLWGGKGRDHCFGGKGRDVGYSCKRASAHPPGLADSFAGTGPLKGYVTNNASALPEVGRVDGRYRAEVTNNADNVTLHYHQSQGRLDAKPVSFPFDIVVRNIGIGTLNDSQTAPSPTANPYVFAGVQVHVTELGDRNSSHVVVGHRGGTHFTIEGKNTRNGSSSVNDAGAGIVPDGRADLRIVGNADRTLTVYWQTPNPNPGSAADSWSLYRGTGRLPGTAPSYDKQVYVGLITYAFEQGGLPFVGTADAIEG